MNVELIICFSCNTWDLIEVKIPMETPENKILETAQLNLEKNWITKYFKNSAAVAYIGLYGYSDID